MGEAKRRARPIGRCIYCGREERLSDAEIVPYGLGGELVLPQASCDACAAHISEIENRLMHGPWMPYQRRLGRAPAQPENRSSHVEVQLVRKSGAPVPALLPLDQHNVLLAFNFDPPSMLDGKARPGTPFGKNALMKQIDTPPRTVDVEGKPYALQPDDQLDIPVNLNAADVTRFLAKVAHGYAIRRLGLDACSEYFLPPIILGSGDGALTYVGNATADWQGQDLPGAGLHAMMDYVTGEFLCVLIQLFRDQGDPMPIYEAVVGRRALTDAHERAP